MLKSIHFFLKISEDNILKLMVTICRRLLKGNSLRNVALQTVYEDDILDTLSQEQRGAKID